MSLWLLVSRDFIIAAYNQKFAELFKQASEDYSAKRRPRAPTNSEIAELTLWSLYLFPHITPSGGLDFSAPLKSDVARSYLTELKRDAGFAERPFTWHGVVSNEL